MGGEQLEYPGDPSGSADQVINCRCSLISVLRPAEDEAGIPRALRDRAQHAPNGARPGLTLDRWFHGAAGKCREIQVRLRGHAMHLATCGLVTPWGPLARRPFGAIHFAGTDGQGEVSDLAGAVETGRQAAQAARTSVDAAARRRRTRVEYPGACPSN